MAISQAELSGGPIKFLKRGVGEPASLLAAPGGVMANFVRRTPDA